MSGRFSTSRGFTLIELIMVMVIIAIIAAVVAPSLQGFSIGRKTNDAASQIIGLAMYARAQSIAEAKPYRLNFDSTSGTYWLTVQNASTYQEPPGDYGIHYQLPDGVKMTVNVNGQFNTQMNIPANTEQVQVQGNPLTDQPNLQVNQLMQNAPAPGQTYVQFTSSGRSDSADITLTDSAKKVIDISCNSATELFHIVKPGETR